MRRSRVGPHDHRLVIETVVVDGAEALRTPLARRPRGIEAFRVEGNVDTSPVRATWDGRSLTATTALGRRLALAVAVDDVFAEAGMAKPRSGPEELLLTILDCCDAIDVLEYELDGRRRVIS